MRLNIFSWNIRFFFFLVLKQGFQKFQNDFNKDLKKSPEIWLYISSRFGVMAIDILYHLR